MAVIIPCFNDGATVEETVRSVLEGQERCELVVVDDGSDDAATIAAFERLRAAGVNVISKRNAGLSAARSTGLDATSAALVLPLDADDALEPGAITALADALSAAPPNVAAAWGDTLVFGDATFRRYHNIRALDPWCITHLNTMPYCALFRREAVDEAGRWTLRGGYEDWDLWLALAERGREAVHISDLVLRYRIHGVRMWAESAARHDAIVAELARRHPGLFRREQRRANWRRSTLPWRVKLLLPLVTAMPLLSSRARQRLTTIASDPRRARAIARSRFSSRTSTS